MFFAPKWFETKLGLDPYRDWLDHKQESAVGVISVWHVAGFRPYVGSLGSWVKERARAYQSKFIGVYFDVKVLSSEAAAEQLARGNVPDVISFTLGEFDPGSLKQFGFSSSEGEISVRGVPYCASGYLLVFDPNAAAGMSTEEIRSKAGSADDFKRGKAVSSVCDVGTAGDLYRAQLVGKCVYFDAFSLKDPPLVQYTGITAAADEAKTPYCAGFIEYLTEGSSQRSLSGLGVIPVFAPESPKYDQPWLDDLYETIDTSQMPFIF